jgi:hypothetical protein
MDHDNLRYYRQPQKLVQHVARYLALLADFDYELQHIAGTKNWADALSRWPDHTEGKEDNDEMLVFPDEVMARTVSLTTLDNEI